MDQGFGKHLDKEVKDYGAGKEIHNLANADSPTNHDHYFTQVGHQASCTCGWGIFLDSKDSVKDGLLYREDTLVS